METWSGLRQTHRESIIWIERPQFHPRAETTYGCEISGLFGYWKRPEEICRAQWQSINISQSIDYAIIRMEEFAHSQLNKVAELEEDLSVAKWDSLLVWLILPRRTQCTHVQRPLLMIAMSSSRRLVGGRVHFDYSAIYHLSVFIDILMLQDNQ